MSYDLNVKIKTEVSPQAWQDELRKHLTGFTFDKSIERKTHSGFLPVEWTDDTDETVSSGYDLSFDKDGSGTTEYFFSSAFSGNEFVAAWLSAATLTLLGRGTLVDPQEGKDLDGAAAVKRALEILAAHKEQMKLERQVEQAAALPLHKIEIGDEDLDVLFNWLVSKKILKDLKTKKGRLDKITSLRKFEPKFVKLGTLPEQFRHLKNLEFLDISFQKYKAIPEWIGELTNLKVLLANNNELVSLPAGLFELKSLEELNLDGNKLTELPDGIGRLRILKKLKVSQNSIQSIPETIGQLTQLQEFDIIINKITVLPDSLMNCSALVDLRVSGLALVRLPEWIGKFRQLKLLLAQSCQLKELPESIGELSSLEFLGVGYNLLTELPESIGNLKNLRRIEAGNNQLKTLPASIEKIKSIESLDLSGNRQLRLTDNLLKLTSLTELRVSSGAVTDKLRKQLEDKDPMCWTSFD